MADENDTTETPTIKEENDEKPERTADYVKLIDQGLGVAVATAMDNLFKEELVTLADFDQRAMDALKEFDEEGALAVLKQFNECNLTQVQNKSAFLCGIMKIQRQRAKAEQEGLINGSEAAKNGPNPDKVKELLDRTNYTMSISTGQRKYGGPPPAEVYEGDPPGSGCQVFVGKIPRTVFEDQLVPLLEKAGTIWDFRLMMDPLTGQNKGYGFASFIKREYAEECVKLMDNYEIAPNKFLGVCVSQSNNRLFVGSIPKTKSKDEIFEEFASLTDGLKDVIIYTQTEDKAKNRGFCFLEFLDHKMASQARRYLSSPKVKAFNKVISVDWADPQEDPPEEVMAKVKVLYVKNLSVKATEEIIKQTFGAYGEIESVKKIKDYAFVHFKEREEAMKALNELNGLKLEGDPIEICLAKPVDKKRRGRQMERKMNRFSGGVGPQYGGSGMGPYRGRRGGYGGPPMMGGYGGGYHGYGGGYGDDYFAGDYMGYGGYDDYGYDDYGGYDYDMPRGGYRNQMGNRGMYGGGGGYGRGRGGYGRGGRARGRGARGGGMGDFRRGRAGKRKGNFGAPSGGKRPNMGGDQSWGKEPIAQQPLGGGDEWFQDSVEEQW